MFFFCGEETERIVFVGFTEISLESMAANKIWHLLKEFDGKIKLVVVFIALLLIIRIFTSTIRSECAGGGVECSSS